MISQEVLSKFDLAIQQKESPDGYPIYISANLSHNAPTVFFEPFREGTGAPDKSVGENFVRITKAGAINHFIVPLTTLESLSFSELQQAIESALPNPG